MKLRLAITMLFIGAFGFGQDLPEPTLHVGDPAPKLVASKWLKGTAVPEFEKGKVYVVDFWATWCGPCRATFPHLTGLAKEYQGKADFIGFSVWEPDQKQVPKFVKGMSDKMGYTIAMDKLPSAAADPTEGSTAKSWLFASGLAELPSAFLVDRNGLIAWVGSPTAVDVPLSKVVEGTWDTAGYAAKVKSEAERKKRLSDYNDRLKATLKAKDDAGYLKVMDEMIADPDPEAQLNGYMAKFRFYLQSKTETAKAWEIGKTLMSGLIKDDPDLLDQMAWFIVDPKATLVDRDLDLALAAAQRSVELKKNYQNLDTLARVYFRRGDKAKAIEADKEALALAPDDQDKKEIAANIKEYGG